MVAGHPLLRAFRDYRVLNALVAEWEVTIDRYGPRWSTFFHDLKRDYPELLRARQTSNDPYGHAIDDLDLIWLSDYPMPRHEFADTVVHEFLHAYEFDAIDYQNVGPHADHARAWRGAQRQHGPLPRRHLSEQSIEREAALIIQSEPHIVEFFYDAYPELRRHARELPGPGKI